MFFWQKGNPADRSNVLEVLGRWDREIDAVDNATDAMRLVAAQDPEDIQSAAFEEKRMTAVQVVNDGLEWTKQPRNWPLLIDDKGSELVAALQVLVNELLAQQLDHLRLQRELVEVLRGGRASERTGDDLRVLNDRMAAYLHEINNVSKRLAKHYRITVQDFRHFQRL